MLLYALEMGGKEAAIIEQCIIQRTPLPEKILGAPSLQLGLEFYYLAFQKLSTNRQVTMGGEGPIPWTAVRYYCDAYEVDGDDAELFEAVIERMDDAYLKWRADTAERNKPPAPIRKVQKRGR